MRILWVCHCEEQSDAAIALVTIYSILSSQHVLYIFPISVAPGKVKPLLRLGLHVLRSLGAGGIELVTT